jgi:ligand-binding sensor domain-containing protein
VFAGTDRGLFRSTDGGASWEMWHVDGIHRDITALHLTSAGILYAATSRDLFRSADHAATWVSAFHSATFNLQDAITSNSKGNVFIADMDGLHASPDGTGSWNTTPVPGRVSALAMDPDGHLLIGTRHDGIFRSRETTVGSERLAIVPSGLHINALWPQPLRTGGTVMTEVSVLKQAILHTYVYDALGRVVLAECSRAVEPGTHIVHLPLSGLIPGAYVLRLTAGREHVTKRFMVVR